MRNTLKRVVYIFLILVFIRVMEAQIINPVGYSSFLSSNSEISCYGRNCTAMLYSSVKYYLENDQWTTINESIGTQNCLPAYSYCVDRNLYQAHFSSGSVKVIDNANHLTMTPISLSTAGLTIPYS